MKIIYFKSLHKDSDEAEKLLKEGKVNFITIVSCSEIDEPTLVVPGDAYSYKGLNEIKEFIQTK